MDKQITLEVYEQPTFSWAESKIMVASTELKDGDSIVDRYALIYANGFDGAFVLKGLLNKFADKAISSFINRFGYSYIDEGLYDTLAGLDDVQVLVFDYHVKYHSDKSIYQYANAYRAEVSGHYVKVTESNLFSPYLNAFSAILLELGSPPRAEIKLLAAKLFSYMSTFYCDWFLYDQLNMSANTSVLIVPSTQEVIKHFDINIGSLSLASLSSPVRDHGGINYRSAEFMKALNMCREDEDDEEDYFNEESQFIYEGGDDDGY